MFLAKDDPSSSKIKSFSIPYFYALSGQLGNNNQNKSAVFLGNNFDGMSKSIDRNAFIDATNKCLDYIRRECKECKLYYKPHPEEINESKSLNLAGFEIVSKEENTLAEVYFWKNIKNIKYTFSIASTAVWSAYMLGINAYTFIRPVEKFTGKDTSSMKDYFAQLPESFFINNFEQKLVENRQMLSRNEILENSLKKSLESGREVWLLAGDPGMLVIYIAFVELIRSLFPGKKINLIIPLHHRWAVMREADYREYFDKIVTFPRYLYSLRPSKFVKIILAFFSIKKLKVDPGDTFLLFANINLVENVILSYFTNKKIAVQYKEYFEINYKIKESMVLAGAKLRVRPAIWIFNRLVEPILGLFRTIYMEYGDGTVLNIVRYIKPATKLYDEIYLLSK